MTNYFRPRRLCLLLLLVFMISLFGSGCSSSKNVLYTADPAKNTAEDMTLTFFGFKYEALNVLAIEKALHSFMAANPQISIAYEGIKGRDYYAALDKRLATGNGDDIFMVDQATLLSLDKSNQLADLSDLATVDRFNSLIKSQMYSGDKLYAIPTSISAFGLYCNLDLLQEHQQQVPTTWPEFTAVCDYFVSQGITPIVANNDISLKTIVLARGLYPIYQGQDPAAALKHFNDGEANLAQALRPGFGLVEQMLQSGYIDRALTLETEKTKDDLTQFAQGQSPFMLTGAWAAPRLRELEPDFTFAIYPYPVLNDGSVLVINLDTRISVNAQSPHVAEAKAFVEFLTQPDVLWEFVNSQCSFSPLDDNRLADDESVQPLGPYLASGHSVLGADDNLHYPIWELSRQCTVKMLEGASAGEAAAYLDQQLILWREGSTDEPS